MSSPAKPSRSAGRRDGAAVVLSISALSVLGGYLLASAVRDSEYSLLGWFSLLPLFLGIRILEPRAAGMCAAVWGGSLYLLSVGSGAIQSRTFLSFLLFAGVPATYALLGARLTRRVGFHPLFLGLGWVGVELALAPFSPHHGLLATSQGNGFLVQFVGTVTGYVFVAFLIALINAVLLVVLSDVAAEGGRSRGLKSSRSPMGWSLAQPSLVFVSCLSGSSHARAPPREPCRRPKAAGAHGFPSVPRPVLERLENKRRASLCERFS